MAIGSIVSESQEKGFSEFVDCIKRNFLDIVIIYAVCLIDVFVASSTSSYFPIVAVNEHGQDILKVTVIMSMISLVSIFGTFIFRDMLSCYGRHKILICGLVLVATASALKSTLVYMAPNGFFIIGIGCYIIHGFGFVARITVALDVITIDYNKLVTYFMGMFELFSSLGAALGPSFGALIYENLGFEAANLIPASMNMSAALTILIMGNCYRIDRQRTIEAVGKQKKSSCRIFETEEFQNEKEPLLAPKENKSKNIKRINILKEFTLIKCFELTPFLLLGLSFGFGTSLTVCFTSTISLYANEKFNQDSIGASSFYLIYHSVACIAPVFIGGLADKYDAHVFVLFMGHVFAIVALIFIGPAKELHINPNPVLTLAVSGILSAGVVCLTLPFTATSLKLARFHGWTIDDNFLKTINEKYLIFLSFGNLIGPIVAGELNKKIGFAETNFYTGIALFGLMVANILSFTTLYYIKKRRNVSQIPHRFNFGRPLCNGKDFD